MRKRRTQEQELADVTALIRSWHSWHRHLCDEALAGPSGALVEQLLEILTGLTLRDGKLLIDFIGSQDWNNIERNTRDVCLFAIDGAIIKLRENAGMTPFDDALDGSPATVFQVVKHLLETA